MVLYPLFCFSYVLRSPRSFNMSSRDEAANALAFAKRLRRWVTKARLGTSTDGKDFEVSGVVFEANTAYGDERASLLLPSPVPARFLRVYPVAWKAHPSLRCAALVVRADYVPSPRARINRKTAQVGREYHTLPDKQSAECSKEETYLQQCCVRALCPARQPAAPPPKP